MKQDDVIVLNSKTNTETLQQLNPGGPNQRQSPNQLDWKFLGWSLY